MDGVDIASAPPASFSLSANPTAVTIVQGASGSTSIGITPTSGFSGSVSLSASGLPNGVTANFSPSSTSTTSMLGLSASATAATGAVTVTINGTSGSLSSGTTISLTVNAAAVSPVTVSPTNLNLGNVIVGRTAKHDLILKNTGATNVTIGAVSLTVTQGNPSDFTFHRYCEPAILKAGKQCSISVSFTADAIATDTATLSIATSAPGSPLQVPITAAGVAKK